MDQTPLMYLVNETKLIEIITKKNLDRKGVTFISEDQLNDYQNQDEESEVVENEPVKPAENAEEGEENQDGEGDGEEEQEEDE